MTVERTARALARLTGLTVAASREDWLGINRREVPPPGTRQEDFTASEVVLCLAAMLLVNHRRFGGSTSHLAPSPVPELARLFRRPPSSVLAKMANLDGSRSHGGKAEKEAAAILLEAKAAGLFASYATILEAARLEGVTPASLPDFLGAESSPMPMLGQEKLSDHEIEQAVAGRVPALAADSGLEEQVTERLLVAVARIGQHVFARDVLANCAGQCVFCGLAPGTQLSGKGLLRASHIKPWRDSTNNERLDVTNGLSACPDHDAAFDAGLIHVGDDLSINAGPLLLDRMGTDPRMREAFGQPPVADRLLLPSGAKAPRLLFIRWHRERIAAA